MFKTLITLLALVPALSAAPTPTFTPTVGASGLIRPFVVNGAVSAVHSMGDKAVIGGSFSWVGPYTGAAARLSSATGKADLVFPRINGTIYAIEPDGSGGWYVGGDFLQVAGVPSGNLIRVLANGSVDPGFTPDPNSIVRLLARAPGGGVYALGSFTMIGGGLTPNRGAKLNSDGSLDSGFSFPPMNVDWVNVIRTDGSHLYLGGSFTQVGIYSLPYLARLDAASGAVDTGFTPAPNQAVKDLALDAGALYAAGFFSSIGGLGRAGIAKLNLGDASADAGFIGSDLPFDGYSSALALSGGDLWVAGQDSGGTYPIARLNASSGAAFGGFSADANLDITAMVYDPSGVLYVAGQFGQLNGSLRHSLGALASSDGSLLAFAPQFNVSGHNALALAPGGVYVGGSFNSAGGYAATGLALVDASTGEGDSSFPSVAGGGVNELKAYGGNLFVGGNFTSIGGESRPYLAKVNLGTKAVDLAFQPSPNGRIDALALDPSGNVFVHGLFSQIGGMPRGGPAKVFGGSGALDSGFPVVNVGSVEDMAVDASGHLYMTGHFTSVNGYALSRAAKVNIATGLPDTDFNPALNDNAFKIQPDGGSNVYIAGRFTTVRGASVVRIAKVSGATGEPVPSFAAAPANGGAVNAIYLDAGQRPVIGGEFTGKLRRMDSVSGEAIPDELYLSGNIAGLAGGGEDLVWVGFANGNIQTYSGQRLGGVGLFKMAAAPSPTPTATPSFSATPSPSATTTPGCGNAALVVGSGPGAGAGQFNEPGHLALRANGEVWVTDKNNNRLVRLDAAGNTLGTLGSLGAGPGQFNYPGGAAFDLAGYVYVADSNNYRVQKLDAFGAYQGQIGSGSSGTDAPVEGSTHLYLPSAVAVDGLGQVYVVERHRLSKWAPDLSTLLAWSAKPGSTLSAAAGSGDGELSDPSGVAVAGSRVFVADGDNHRIEVFDAVTLAWQTRISGLSYPISVWVDGDALWVVNAMGSELRKYDRHSLALLDSFGNASTWGNAGSPYPVAMVVDGAGRAWVADRFAHQVLRFDVAGCTPPAPTTPTASPTAAATATVTPTATPTASPSATGTATPTGSPTATTSVTPSGTPTPTFSPSATLSATPSVTPSATQTSTAVPSATFTVTPTSSATPDWTATPTHTPGAAAAVTAIAPAGQSLASPGLVQKGEPLCVSSADGPVQGIEVFNMVGQKVATLGNDPCVQTTALSPGMYYLRVNVGGKTQVIKVVIKP